MAAVVAETPKPVEDATRANGTTTKQPTSRKRAPATETAAAATTHKAPVTKRRRMTPKAAPKSTATPKKGPTRAAAKQAEEASSESDSSEEEEEEEEEEESSPTADALPTQRSTVSDVEMLLKNPRRQMTADAIDILVPLILKDERREADGKLLVISSINLQAVLSRFFHNDGTIGDDVYKLLGVTREQVDKADAIAVVVHGPHTEEVRSARLRYDGKSVDNYHWSLVCWFRSVPEMCFHYDSLRMLSDRRCSEVVSILRRVGVLPRTVAKITFPDFFPEQVQEWECGYELLTAITIIAGKPTPDPITEDDVYGGYKAFFSTLASAGVEAPFLRRLRALLTREKYGFSLY